MRIRWRYDQVIIETPQNTTRYQGQLVEWKDAQGYGFITPRGGGDDVFVHISSFTDQRVRPMPKTTVTYRLVKDERSRWRALDVAYLGSPAIETWVPRRRLGLLSITLGFFGIMVCLWIKGDLPVVIPLSYLAVSLFEFLLYASDKAAAQDGSWRVPEDLLHLFALFGGWPGALAGQALFDHKTTKKTYRRVFWVMVALNCLALSAYVAAGLSGIDLKFPKGTMY